MKMKTRNPAGTALNVPPQWSGYYRKLHSLRSILLEHCSDQIAEMFEPVGSPGMDLADYATETIDRNMALGILANERDALSEVEAAIQRIRDGTYGVCENSGKPIPEARLKVVPWTRFTKETLEGLERRRRIECPHLWPVVSTQVSHGRGNVGNARRQRRERTPGLAGAADLAIPST